MPHTSRLLEPGNSSAFLRPPAFELPLGRIEASLSSESYTGRLPPIDPRRTAANSVSLPTVAEILQSQSFASEESVLNTISYKPVTPTQQNRDVIKAGRVFYAIAMDIASFTPTVWRAEASFGVSLYEGFLVIRTGMGDKLRARLLGRVSSRNPSSRKQRFCRSLSSSGIGTAIPAGCTGRIVQNIDWYWSIASPPSYIPPIHCRRGRQMGDQLAVSPRDVYRS
ncbi:hypothetical protein FRB93_012204 [Tulasnella sp. JGI-2019a]|nr:hypothetical protein FRB93_012204 [Tulasnella sp. JGI-2019a]